ncbi:hypothetical protein Tco_0669223 [Tanacetum coccineum]
MERKLQRIRYVVPTGRVVVPTGRYVVPAGKVIIIVSPGRLILVPTGRVLSPGSKDLSRVGSNKWYQSLLRVSHKKNSPRSKILIVLDLTMKAIMLVFIVKPPLLNNNETFNSIITLISNYICKVFLILKKERSIPDDHVADFHYMDDAKDIWNAVKARFGGNAESKKMRKSMLKQEFLEFRISEAEGLHKGYDRMQKILSQLNQLKSKPEDEDINLKFLRAFLHYGSQLALKP